MGVIVQVLLNIPTIGYGPSNSSLLHIVYEYIELDELYTFANSLIDLALRLQMNKKSLLNFLASSFYISSLICSSRCVNCSLANFSVSAQTPM